MWDRTGSHWVGVGRIDPGQCAWFRSVAWTWEERPMQEHNTQQQGNTVRLQRTEEFCHPRTYSQFGKKSFYKHERIS